MNIYDAKITVTMQNNLVDRFMEVMTNKGYLVRKVSKVKVILI